MVADTGTLIRNCWNTVGVGGDRSCGELETVIHCRNCPIYADIGRGLLDREIPAAYLDDWTDLQPNQSGRAIAQPAFDLAATISVMILRLAEERLALPVKLLQEVTPVSVVHTLPQRSNDLFRGLVNVRGEVLMCVSLHHLLNLEQPSAKKQPEAKKVKSTEQMVVIAKDGDRWVFVADDICGFHRFSPVEMQVPPMVVAKSNQTYTRGVIEWQNQLVNYLDADLLFHTLNRRIL